MKQIRPTQKVEVIAERADLDSPRQNRAALYVRVSTEEQVQEGYSLEAQVERLQAYALSKGWDVAETYVDGGFTGRDTKRPAYLRMMEEIGSWDVLLVLKMDRVHRNQRNFTAMMDRLLQEDRVFASVYESIDGSTAMGRFVMGVIQQIAQLESEQIGERVLFAFKKAVDDGKRNMGQAAPWGYRWSEGDPERGTGELVVREERRELVERVFELWVAGRSAGKIAKELGWCSCKPKKVQKTWTLKDGTVRKKIYSVDPQDCSGCSRVRYIYNNPAYAGYLIFMGQIWKGEHEPIVSREVFEAAQARRPRRRIPLPAEVEA